MYMKKVYILIAVLSMFMLVSTVTAQLKPNDYHKIYTLWGENHWFWSWQIENKANEMINNSRYRMIKDRIIDRIGFDNFYNITYNSMVNTLQKTGFVISNDYILGFRWIPRAIYNWIEINAIIHGLSGYSFPQTQYALG